MEVLVENAKNGSKEATEELIKNIYNQLYGIAFLKLKNEMDAQDVVQETLILIYNNIKQLRDNNKFKSWAIRILINECNKKYKDKFKNMEDIEDYRNICSNQNLEDIVNKLDAMDMFKNLKRVDRDIMILHYYNYRTKEIAEILNIKENTIKTKLKRIKSKLNKNYKLDKEKGTIVDINKLRKMILSILLVLLITTGIVYATITIVKFLDRVEEPQPIKWVNCGATINAIPENIEKYMQKYDDNIYMVLIKDKETFHEIKSGLNLQILDEEIRDDLFDKYQYDVLIITFEQKRLFRVKNLLTYSDKIEIEITLDKENLKERNQNTFCIFIPKLYSDRKIELIYKNDDDYIEQPKNAITYKFSECYIENIEEFDKINISYDNEQDIYYSRLLDINDYKELDKQLGIVLERPKLQNGLESYDIILILKKTTNKLTSGGLKIRDNKPKVTLTETDQPYGKGISGAVYGVTKGTYTDYDVLVK